MEESGGMISVLYGMMYPFATLVSKLRFELGVMSMLFMGRTAIARSNPSTPEERQRRST